jgi:hypothetical protein
MCTVPVSLARLSSRSSRGTGSALGGTCRNSGGVGGGPAAGGDRGKGLGKGRWEEPGESGSGGTVRYH